MVRIRSFNCEHGKGKMVLSTLKLLENLNYDPFQRLSCLI